MKVFISWSGGVSRDVAELLAEWIPDVLQGVTCWFSADDIEKGSLWFNQIDSELNNNNVGILCLTAENVDAPWILFEAGALSKGLSKSRVCPILLGGLSTPDIRAPLSHFNLTLPSEEDMLRLLRAINQFNVIPLDDERLEKSYKVWWSQFETKYKQIIAKAPILISKPRKTEDILEEVLDGMRQIQRSLPTTRPYSTNSLVDLMKKPAVTVIQEIQGLATNEYNRGIFRINVLRSTPVATGSGKFNPAMVGTPAISLQLLEAPEGNFKYAVGIGTHSDFHISLTAVDYKEPLQVGEYVLLYEANSASAAT